MKREQRFDALCEREPRLRALYEKARAIRDDGTAPAFCTNNLWVNELKPILLGLVGWEVRDPELATSEAYDLAYETIYDALPDCRNCSCYPVASALRKGGSVIHKGGCDGGRTRGELTGVAHE